MNCICGFCKKAMALINHADSICHEKASVVDEILHKAQKLLAPIPPVNPPSPTPVTPTVTPPSGTNGMTMVINYGYAYLVRLNIPTISGSFHGKYAEGYDADYGTAVAQALAGLN